MHPASPLRRPAARRLALGAGLIGSLLLCLGMVLGGGAGMAEAQRTVTPGVASTPAPAPARAMAEPGASAWAETGSARLRLLADTTATGDRDSLLLGLEVDLKKPWKVYWRSPGDAGYPPAIDWNGSVNLAGADMLFPVPERFSLQGIETVGYHHPLVFPLEVTPDRPGDPLILTAQVDFLACTDICVPETASLSMILPPGPAAPSPHLHRLAQARAGVPGQGRSHGLAVTEAVIEPGGQVRVAVTADPPLTDPDLFLEAPPGMAFSAPEVTLTEGGRQAVLRAAVKPGGLGHEAEGEAPPADPLLGRTLAALVADGDRGVETVIETATLAPAAPVAPSAPAQTTPNAGGGGGLVGLAVLGGMALLGGLILNLMPCVLPVLSLKILALVGHGGGDRVQARRAFLATSAGIVFSFLVLAGLAIGLKAAGAAVGWGIQFQQPLFVVALVAVLTLFVGAMWGVLDIPLPGFVAALGTRGGGSEAEEGGVGGHFATGAFATLLATPCSAPFLGTAVGAALAGGPSEALILFALMGLGMALPYLLVAAWPGVATRLPRPGPWMDWLKAALGLALAGTAVWLLTVLDTQVGAPVALAIGGAMAAILGLLALGRRWRPLRRPAAAGVILLLAGAVALAARPQWAGGSAGGVAGVAGVSGGTGIAPAEAIEEDPGWRSWSPETLDALVAEGRVVLVDVTAAWCATCQVNKATVLRRGRVAAALESGAVVGLRAHWDRPDPVVTDYLMSFGRFGIPFNAVYGPSAPEGLPLPEILTESLVLDAIKRAGGAGQAGEAGEAG